MGSCRGLKSLSLRILFAPNETGFELILRQLSLAETFHLGISCALSMLFPMATCLQVTFLQPFTSVFVR